jgi:hypothetical protein
VSGSETILRLSAEGKIDWQGEIPVVEPLMVSPKLACNDERLSIVWAVKISHKETQNEQKGGSRLCVVTVEGTAMGEPLEFEFDDLIFDLSAVATEHAVTVACIHGDSNTSLELILISNEEIAQRVTI